MDLWPSLTITIKKIKAPIGDENVLPPNHLCFVFLIKKIKAPIGDENRGDTFCMYSKWSIKKIKAPIGDENGKSYEFEC